MTDHRFWYGAAQNFFGTTGAAFVIYIFWLWVRPKFLQIGVGWVVNPLPKDLTFASSATYEVMPRVSIVSRAWAPEKTVLCIWVANRACGTFTDIKGKKDLRCTLPEPSKRATGAGKDPLDLFGPTILCSGEEAKALLNNKFPVWVQTTDGAYYKPSLGWALKVMTWRQKCCMLWAHLKKRF